MSISDERALAGLISRLEAGELLTQACHAVTFESEQASQEVHDVAAHSRSFGGGVVPALKAMLAQWISKRETQEHLAAELAAPMLTKRIIAWLPLFALLAAQVMGFDVLGSLRSGLVLVSLALGAGMLWLAHRWCNSIVGKALPRVDPMIAELGRALIALSAGATWLQVRESGMLSAQTLAGVRPAIQAARTRGSPIKTLVESEIRVRQNAWMVSAKASIRDASVRLSLPMGLAMLPALVFLVVIPVFASITDSSQGVT